MSSCTLCALPTPDPPVTGEDIDGEFCCRGCLEVYRALGDVDPATVDPADLQTPPADDTAQQRTAAADTTTDHTETATDFIGATDSTEATEPPDDAETTYLTVEGMHCSTCETFIEATATNHDGVYAAEASYATDMMAVTHAPDILDASGIPDIVSKLGYRAALPEDDETEQGGIDIDWRLYLGLLFGMQLMMIYIVLLYPSYYGIFPTEHSAALPILLWVLGWGGVVVFWVGFPILRGAYVSLTARQPNMDLLIALGALVPYTYSAVAVALGHHEIYVDVSTMIVVVVTVGNAVERTFKRNAVETLRSLSRTRVSEARLQRADGTTRIVAIEACEPGDRLLVKPGESVPVDGTVLEGTAAVDEAVITGESVPETKRPGDGVVGGSMVTDGSLSVAVGDDATSTLDRLVELLWNVQTSTTGVQRLADRLARVFVPVVVVLAVATTLGWVAVGESASAALLTGVAVLVVSCPCSFGLATPLAIVSGVREAADCEIVVTNTAALQRIHDTDIVAFDKTGTLTTGEMQVVGVSVVGEDATADAPINTVAETATAVADSNTATADAADADTTADADELLARAAAVESRSSHPIAEAIVDESEAPNATITEFERHARGVTARVDGKLVAAGSPDLFCERGWTVPESAVAAIETARNEGHVPVGVGWDRGVRGVIAVSDTPRSGWEGVVERIAAAGRRVVVITGDDAAMATRFENHPAVDSVFSEVRPEAKVAVVERLCAEGTTTMVGDGTNDAPALASADFGMAMANGTDITVDAADAVVTAEKLHPVVDAFEIAAGTRRRVRQNLGWAFSYNVVAIPLAIAGLINPLVASLAMATSSIVVVTNSVRAVRNR